MLKRILTTVALLLAMSSAIHAQTSMRVPHGSFEQWSPHAGYSASVMGLNVPIYDTFSTPVGWDYLSYHINESFSFMGLSLNVNTDIPLVKVGRETANVPDSSRALRLQSFMLSDLVSPVVYALAVSAIDSTLTQTVLPTVLSTGQIDLEAFVPIIGNLLTNADSIEGLLISLAQMDVNELIAGGLALGGFEPSRLTGSYKYQSAGSGDKGGVLMLGTHYNAATHQRDVVGVGANVELTDISNYTPFTVDYTPLHQMESSFPDQAPDSLVILILSSASDSMQQGSALCVDNLVLWHDTVPVVEPDTCAAIVGLTAVPDIHEAALNWSTTAVVDSFELEYGPAGFAQGSGTTLSLTNNTATLTALAANTAYDIYLRTLCSDSIYGDWSFLQFQTGQDTCARVLDLTLQVVPDANFYEIRWWSATQPHHWEVEYGLQGFEPGNGTVVTTTEPYFGIYTIDNTLQPNTWYDFYVRSVCDGGIYGEWDSVHYRTACAHVQNLAVEGEGNLTFTPDSLVSGYKVTWTDTTATTEWMVEYTLVGPGQPDLPPRPVSAIVDAPEFNLPPLRPDHRYRVEVRALCGEGNMGEIMMVVFVTAPLPVGIAESGQTLLAVSPNPAHGSCTVSLADGQPAELRLYTLEGRLLRCCHYAGEPVDLQLPSRGVFLLHVVTPSGAASCKIVNR